MNRSRRKAAEDKLKESEDRFRTIFNSINDAVFIHDIETGAILNVNNTTCNMYGYTREELRRLDVQTVSMGEAPYAQEDAIKWIKKATAGEPQVFEWMAKHKSGRLFRVEVNMRSAVIGGHERMLVVVRDITERKRAEDALAESEKKLSQIVNGSSTPIFVIDKTHTVTHWNKACENLTGVSAKEMVGTRRQWSPFYSHERPVLADIIVDGSTEEEIAGYYGDKFRKSALIDGAYEVEDFFPGFGDKWLFLTAAPLRDDHGNVTGAIESLRDITERKAAEDALRESEEKYRVLFETAKDAIFLADEAGKFVDVNSAACESLGYGREELLKMSNKEIDADPIGYETFTKVRDGVVKEAVFEVNQKRKDGTLVPVEISGKVIQSDGSKIFLAIARDITERKRSDEKLKQTMADLKRSNTDLEQFAYVVSHDLQEPLRMVTSYVQLLSKRYKDKLDSDADDFIGFAVDGASRMHTLIQDLLTYSRVGTRGNPLTPAACEDALDQALANLKLTIEDSGAVVTHDPLPTVAADSSQLVQLFQNLIGNAIKFHDDEPLRVHVAVERKDDEWKFSVVDNGIGIDPEFFERIFVIFQRLHGREEYSGTGIGLAVCKKIVDRHGGRMWVESEPGRGATFYFTIPAVPVEGCVWK